MSTKAVTFLEDQAMAITIVPRADPMGKPLVVVGVGNALNLYSQELDMMDTVAFTAEGKNERIVRLATLGSSRSVFVASSDSSLALQTVTPSGQLGKLDQLSSPIKEGCFDADIHRSGHLASVLFESHVALIDTQRDTVIGGIPVGKTGTPNGLRIVENSLVAVGSAVVSLFDLRTPECKQGTASHILSAVEAKGRIFTCIESDGVGSVVAGDSSGGLWLWKSGKPEVEKNVHAHSGAVLGMALGSGVLGSASADGAVALWTVSQETVPSNQAKKKSRKLLLDMHGINGLRRAVADGTGTPVAVAVEDSVGGDVAYVTDTGVLVVAPRAEWL
jgi:hypothetical protein